MDGVRPNNFDGAALFRRALEPAATEQPSTSASRSFDTASGKMLLHAGVPAKASGAAEWSDLPAPGDLIGRYRIVRELGRGAFARVFLATDQGLANRLVALKFSLDVAKETDVLPRLQHTNIVPVYSVSSFGRFGVICMPYLGERTLGDVLCYLKERPQRPGSILEVLEQVLLNGAGAEMPADLTASRRVLGGRSYEEGVLWLIASLADGLGYAHEAGVLHHDLKPANVLLTNHGQVMLVDFNLSEDTSQRREIVARVGGTIPYMAPEQKRAFAGEPTAVDERADLYSLGILLFELLAGRHPFDWPSSTDTATCVPAPLDVRVLNPRVGPAVASIVRKSLQSDASQRYQTARQLQEDIYRYLNNQRLRYAADPSLVDRARRWSARRPVAAYSIVAVVLLLLVSGLWSFRQARIAATTATTLYASFTRQAKSAQLALITRADQRDALRKDIDRSLALLNWYQAPTDDDWQNGANVRLLSSADRRRLADDVGTLLFLLSEAIRQDAGSDRAHRAIRLREALDLLGKAERCFNHRSIALAAQRERLRKELGADELKETSIAAGPGAPPEDALLRAAYHISGREYARAMEVLNSNAALPERKVQQAFLVGLCHLGLSQGVEALACFSRCVVLAPDSHWSYYLRGQTHARQSHFQQALADLDAAVRLAPTCSTLYVERARVHEELQQYDQAISDLGLALENGESIASVYRLRSRLYRSSGQVALADQDESKAKKKPVTADEWYEKGLSDSNPVTALRAMENALELHPIHQRALQRKAFLLSKGFKKHDEALQVLDVLVGFYPENAFAWRFRASMRATVGDRVGAHADAVQSLQLEDSPAANYQVANVYGYTARTNPEDGTLAILHLQRALERGYGNEKAAKDAAFRAIRHDSRFQDLISPLNVK